MERLPQISYSLLKDNALRKKLSELGIPNSGPRALLIRRHTEWVNLVNANCDSPRPRTKRELLHELDIWDKTQGRQLLNISNSGLNASSVMNKDFDGAAWAASHGDDFQTLIARARKKNTQKSEDTSSKGGTPKQLTVSDDSNSHLSTGSVTGVAQHSTSDRPPDPTDVVDPAFDKTFCPTKQCVVDLDSES